MKHKIKAGTLYILLVLFFMPACQWAGSLVGGQSTVTPPPTYESAPTETATPNVTTTATPTGPTPGSFDDFKVFATQIAQAVTDKDASFFSGQAGSYDWNCLGDETVGVCKDHTAGETLHGFPVTQDWATYKVYSQADYQTLWQKEFAKSDLVKLAGVANQFSDNPLMPMADQSFMAVFSVAGKGSPNSAREVQVLYFEYSGTAWQLDGELDVTKNINDWLGGACSACYDSWTAWTN